MYPPLTNPWLVDLVVQVEKGTTSPFQVQQLVAYYIYRHRQLAGISCGNSDMDWREAARALNEIVRQWNLEVPAGIW